MQARGRPREEAPAGAVSLLEAWAKDPILYVRDNFGATPDFWQAEVLHAAKAEPRIAMKACKGPGKTTVLSWVGLWFLGTRYDANILSTSITFPNHRDNLWKETALWYGKSDYLQSVFTMNTERIEARARPRTWWWSARSWSAEATTEQQANSLAGLHSDHVMILLDESGDYPEGVVHAAEGIFANKVEARLLLAGNPTKVTGPFHRICTQEGGREVGRPGGLYYVVRITGDPDSPRRSPRIDMENARSLIRRWGRDSYIVRVNVLGEFPLKGSEQLLDPQEVDEAMSLRLTAADLHGFARVLGVDPARHGENATVIFPRQGRCAFAPKEHRDLDGMQVAAVVAQVIDRWRPHLVTMDAGGVGGPIADRLTQLGYSVVQVDFGGKAIQSDRFLNRRAEMWWNMAQWIRGGGAVPAHQDLRNQLLAMPYEWSKESLLKLPSKEKLAEQGLASPDHADALALTFAFPDPILDHVHGLHGFPLDYEVNVIRRLETDYDPFDANRPNPLDRRTWAS